MCEVVSPMKTFDGVVSQVLKYSKQIQLIGNEIGKAKYSLKHCFSNAQRWKDTDLRGLNDIIAYAKFIYHAMRWEYSKQLSTIFFDFPFCFLYSQGTS